MTLRAEDEKFQCEHLDLEQQVCEWGNAGAEVETAFAAKLPTLQPTITTSIALKILLSDLAFAICELLRCYLCYYALRLHIRTHTGP